MFNILEDYIFEMNTNSYQYMPSFYKSFNFDNLYILLSCSYIKHELCSC